MSASSSATPGTNPSADEQSPFVGQNEQRYGEPTAANEESIENPPPAEPATSINSVSASSLEPDTSEQDDTLSNIDSAIGSWRSQRTQSLTSSVANFQFENGRRYHAYREGSYHLPNDENEQDRLDMQHHIYRIALDDKLFLAPIPKEKLLDVLDVGCGTGLWCIDVADENPQAQALGFDLSPIQPDLVPPNCKFLVDDCNSDWVFGQQFDLIHTRAMTPGIRDWPRYLRQAYDNLKPGGYIELHEISIPPRCTEDTATPTPYFIEWANYLIEAGSEHSRMEPFFEAEHIVGLEFTAPKKLRGYLETIGFTNINVRWQHWPVGPWAKGARNKEIGRWWAEDLKDVTRNTGALFTRVLGWKQDEFDVYAAHIANEITAGKKHLWVEMCFAYAQKPEAGA